MDPCFFLQLISIPVNLSDLVLMRTTLSSHPCTLCQSAALSVSPALSPLQRVECLSFASDRFSQVECHTGCFKYSSVRGKHPTELPKRRAAFHSSGRRASAFVPSHGFVMKGLMNVVQYDIMTHVLCLMTLNLMSLLHLPPRLCPPIFIARSAEMYFLFLSLSSPSGVSAELHVSCISSQGKMPLCGVTLLL